MRVGLVGIGFMGWIHYLAYQRAAEKATAAPDQRIEIAAICTRDSAKRAGDWTSIQGNFGPPGETVDVSSMRCYESLDSLLKDDAIDLIDICLPPHLHVSAVESALSAGKHVLCEKPLALNAESAQRLLDLDRQLSGADGRLMVAQILPFMNGFRELHAATKSGEHGPLRSLRLKRFISPPDWIPDFYDADRVGGPLVDLHVHDAHLINLLMGPPVDTFTASDCDGSMPVRYESLFRYADGRYASCGGGVIGSSGRPFTHGFEANFENATMQLEFAAFADGTSEEIPLVLVDQKGQVVRPDSGDGDPVAAFVRQAEAVAQWMTGGPRHDALDPVHAVEALRLCEAQMPNETKTNP